MGSPVTGSYYKSSRTLKLLKSNLKKPHVDQDPLNLGSQAATTTDASSTSNANTHDDQSTSQRRGKRRSFSAYSYRSDLDACQFLRQVDGRVSRSAYITSKLTGWTGCFQLFNSLNDTYFMPSGEVFSIPFSTTIWDCCPQMTMSGLDCMWLCQYGYGVLTHPRNKQHIAFVLAFGGLCPASDVVNAVLASQEGVRKKILDIGKKETREMSYLLIFIMQGLVQEHGGRLPKCYLLFFPHSAFTGHSTWLRNFHTLIQ